MNKKQWTVIGIVCFLIAMNMGIVIMPVYQSRLWGAHIVLLCVCSGFYYILRSGSV